MTSKKALPKLLLYCTKAKPFLRDKHNIYGDYHCFQKDVICANYLNGKIVAECDFEVEEIIPSNLVDFETESCVDRISMFKYLKPNLIWDNKFEILLNTFGSIRLGYAIHIKNLHIFDKPRELSEYDKYEYEMFSGNRGCLGTEWKPVEKAPQNMMYCYEEGEKKVLISIQPQELCKILNGEKTVVIKKKVLKEMF